MQDAQVTITGYVGTDVEFRPGNGNDRAMFRLGSTSRFRDRDGEWRDRETVWMTVKAWRTLAQNIAASVQRGEPVIVTGRMQAEKWADDGGQHYRDVLVATTVAHDLNRGTTAFRRNERPAGKPVFAAAAPVAATPAGEHPRDGEHADRHGGMPEPAPA
ncbi:single-stranded DNA-binding protein [Solicola gregarius]|uniref:Single-stranded DNA-binding protein n=1 Tax=Solicola gregarius TaxID=2908642 RepID=A0AA46TF80_9ACTN|nr:single-stranded DNA-binding protein [Solicola gregarius]UYM04252.1 single-stranded DNA-binding protein [Solicola gregarius]